MKICEVIAGLVHAVRAGDTPAIDELLGIFATMAGFDDAMALRAALLTDLSTDGPKGHRPTGARPERGRGASSSGRCAKRL